MSNGNTVISSFEINSFKLILSNIITTNNNNKNLKDILMPSCDICANKYFINNIETILKCLTVDKKTFLQDICLLSENLLCISHLLTYIILLLHNKKQITHKDLVTDEVIYKILYYIFLIILPELLGVTLTKDEQNVIIEIVAVLCNIIKSNELVQNSFNKIKEWLNNNNCFCFKKDNNNVIKNKLLDVKIYFKNELNNTRKLRTFKLH